MSAFDFRNEARASMHLRVLRKWFTEKSTVGELLVDDVFEAFTLEDRVRKPGTKVKGKTAIPPGTYRLVVDHSPKYARPMPHVLDVPMFSGIRIHSGNDADDTEGCLLVGTVRGQDVVLHSRDAYARLFQKIQAAQAKGQEITIEYVNVEPPEELLA